MTNAQLTIIIPFLNEGKEIANTLSSIQDTATGMPAILLINDASTDGYNYRTVAEQYNCDYIQHEERLGVAESRNEGVRTCNTPYFLLLDGHMRFYEKGWDEKLLALLQENPRTILCGQTKKLLRNENGEIVEGEHKTCYGAYIDMSEVRIFKAAWNYTDPTPYTPLSEIPCILGAAYACSKEYWLYLRGLEGLRYYGLDEELLSLKVWCEGGRCLLVKDWIVGHIYRSEFPYEVPSKEIVYNRMLVIELFLPYELKRKAYLRIKNACEDIFIEVYDMLKTNYPFIKELKEYIQSISQRNIEFFFEKNHGTLS